MKITKTHLTRIIKEEVENVVTEEAGTLANLEKIYGDLAHLFQRVDQQTVDQNNRNLKGKLDDDRKTFTNRFGISRTKMETDQKLYGFYNMNNSNIIIYIFPKPMDAFQKSEGIPSGRYLVLHPTAGIEAHYKGDLNADAVLRKALELTKANFEEAGLSVPVDPVAYKQMYGHAPGESR